MRMISFSFLLGGMGKERKRQQLFILKLFIRIKPDGTLISFCRVKADVGGAALQKGDGTCGKQLQCYTAFYQTINGENGISFHL